MEISTEYIVLIPLIVGVVQVIKTTGLSARYLPIASLVLGIIGAVFLGAFDTTSIVQGLIAGLSASGLWSSVKSTIT